MHELGIAVNIIKIVEGELASRGIDSQVDRVTVRIGKLHAVIPASLEFHFGVVCRESAKLKRAKLHVEEVPVVVRCGACDIEVKIEEPIFACERCGGAVSVVSGEEMIVSSISTGGGEDGD
ncbi:MAG TPA: hydrogenase maturation nickel metallochaperone HypA [bacterium]|nr:hydrogenase maturation nickel metallochaperone HypA [bacterium]